MVGIDTARRLSQKQIDPPKGWTPQLTELMRYKLQVQVEEQGYHVEVEACPLTGDWEVLYVKMPEDVTNILHDMIIVHGRAFFTADHDIYWELTDAPDPTPLPQEGNGNDMPVLP